MRLLLSGRIKMKLHFETASDGELSCTAGKFRLHSSYNPSREAERFANSAECSFNPRYILVSGPALSYCAGFLKKRFPGATLCCIRYSSEFHGTDTKWNAVFYAFDKTAPEKENAQLSEELFACMGDEGIASCLFLSWKPSELPFKKLNDFAWKEIKKAALKSRSVLATRAYFSRRWARNALRFSLFVKNTAVLLHGTSAAAVCASGPSLKQSIPFIKKFRERFFLIAVSSALSALCRYGISPDLCISTDGGYWAKLHLSFALKNSRIPLALPGEGACFASILSKTPVIPLYYGDGCSQAILQGMNYQGMKAFRNGSVSGTAALLALSLTEGPVFFCGLDLCASKGFFHIQPNELDTKDALSDSRLHTAETRAASAVTGSSSTKIYRSWFSSADFGGRLFRLSDNCKYSSPLGKTADINWNDFERMTEDFRSRRKPSVAEIKTEFNSSERKERLRIIARQNCSNPEWIKSALPAESIMQERAKGTAHEAEVNKKIAAGMELFYDDMLNALGRKNPHDI